MVWKSPKTWSTGDGVWNWLLNTEIRDPLMTLRNMNDNAIQVSLVGEQVITPSTNVAIRWDSQDWAASGGSSLLWTNGPDLLAPIAGWYELDAKVVWSSGGATGNTRMVRYSRSDSPTIRYDLASIEDNLGTRTIVQTALAIVQLTTVDSIQVGVYQDTPDDQSLVGSTGDRTRCTWRLLGGAT